MLTVVAGFSVDLFTGDAQLRTRLEQAVFFSDPRVSAVAAVEVDVLLADSVNL